MSIGARGFRPQWSPEQTTTLLKMAAQGCSMSEMAAAVCKTSEATRMRLKSLKVEYTRRPRNGALWSETDDNRLRRLIEARASMDSIGTILNRTPKAIRSRCTLLGLHTGPRKVYAPREDEAVDVTPRPPKILAPMPPIRYENAGPEDFRRWSAYTVTVKPRATVAHI